MSSGSEGFVLRRSSAVSVSISLLVQLEKNNSDLCLTTPQKRTCNVDIIWSPRNVHIIIEKCFFFFLFPLAQCSQLIVDVQHAM